ncbi:hypothetical protein ABB02_01794 [Clostridiaceae bacterium JG1575]|nr:hypothetical protein ABB02_01794 [Clostridiaceae bacterium JG1575]
MAQSTNQRFVQEKVSAGRVIVLAGAFVGLLIGSGFATGQEIMQYFVSYGYAGILGAIACLVLLAFVGMSFTSVGNAEQFERGSEIYGYYCGPYLGKFYDVFSNIFVYMSYIIMISGAAATGAQQYGLPRLAGGGLMMAASILCVLLGLKKFINIIGTIMPVVITVCLILALIVLSKYAGQIPTNQALIPGLVASGTIKRVSVNWFMATLSYVGFCMLWLAAFLAETGRTCKGQKESRWGSLTGALAFSVAVILLTLALMSKVPAVAGADIPSLILANEIHPLFGNLYSLMMFIGIFTTAVPLLWNPCARFAKEGTPRFRILVLGLGIAGGIIGLFVEFPQLINILYGINGYVGILLLILMVVHFVRYGGFLKPSSKEKLGRPL